MKDINYFYGKAIDVRGLVEKEELVEEIFEYFEKDRVCKNCKYCDNSLYCCDNEDNLELEGFGLIKLCSTFGCNIFEAKGS